ncbi:Glycosyltransferase, GT2 family [Sphingomonas laterariae]|uniref:Glycosyltransferase, GT2 family n=1 Tax=Edaphosphingomonas laterariae TaxID=861865 RepID=A0A239IPA6_9SPHN|nr:glycosyltransferase [Sphingomonas laterariae]SNS94244.1 Glycosyltransferase, GT2 family [Sphingomonas laterariae]
MRIHVVIPSVGRAAILAKAVDRLADQTRPPDGVVVVVTGSDDIAGMEQSRLRPEILFSRRGSCVQRNVALDHLADGADVAVLLDDDFVPARDYLEQVERWMSADPAIAGIGGTLVADGILGDPIPFEDAVARLDRGERPVCGIWERESLYGCNMAISMAAAIGLRFDERLPLYGWQEDIDFTSQLARRGRLVSGPQVAGIHLGVRSARSPGRQLGYSQVANIVYLCGKGTMPLQHGRRMLTRNLAANLVRSLWPEAHIDRRGRLAGNLLAVADLMRGRLDPQRAEQL